jgi:hypothetical protein
MTVELCHNCGVREPVWKVHGVTYCGRRKRPIVQTFKTCSVCGPHLPAHASGPFDKVTANPIVKEEALR